VSRSNDLAFLADVVTRARLSDSRVATVEDWPFVLDCAGRFMILPTLAASLVTNEVPDSVAAVLEETRANTAARNGLLRVDLAHVSSVLANAGIPFLVTKGAALLLHRLVHDAARHLEDIDLRLEASSIERGRACLAAAGFQIGQVLDVHGEPSPEVQCWAPCGTLVELHRSAPGAPRRTFEAELADSVECSIGQGSDVRVRVPSQDALLAGLSDHVLFHHTIDPRYVARHVADVRTLVEAGARPRGLASTVSGYLLDAVSRAPRLGGRLLFPRGAHYAIQSAFADRLTFVKNNLRPDRPSTILRRVFPSTAYLEYAGHDTSAWGRVRRLIVRPLRPRVTR
jgi:hypothetical protein